MDKSGLLKALLNDPEQAMKLVSYKIGTIELPQILLVSLAEVNGAKQPYDFVKNYVESVVIKTIKNEILKVLLSEKS